MREWFLWWFWRRWTPRVRYAIAACDADKGYLSVGDWETIRATCAGPFKEQHWALRKYPCKHRARQRTNHGLATCKDCDKVFMLPSRSRMQRVISMFD